MPFSNSRDSTSGLRRKFSIQDGITRRVSYPETTGPDFDVTSTVMLTLVSDPTVPPVTTPVDALTDKADGLFELKEKLLAGSVISLYAESYKVTVGESIWP